MDRVNSVDSKVFTLESNEQGYSLLLRVKNHLQLKRRAKLADFKTGFAYEISITFDMRLDVCTECETFRTAESTYLIMYILIFPSLQMTPSLYCHFLVGSPWLSKNMNIIDGIHLTLVRSKPDAGKNQLINCNELVYGDT